METIPLPLDKEERQLLDWLVEVEQTSREAVMRRIVKEGLLERILTIGFELYNKKRISLWKIAELARMPLADVMIEARTRRVMSQYDSEELTADLQQLNK